MAGDKDLGRHAKGLEAPPGGRPGDILKLQPVCAGLCALDRAPKWVKASVSRRFASENAPKNIVFDCF